LAQVRQNAYSYHRTANKPRAEGSYGPCHGIARRVGKTWWFKIWVGNGCSWEQVESQRSTVGVASCDCPIAWRLTYMIAKCHQLGVFDTLRMDPDSAETWKKCFQEHTSALKELRTQVVSNPEGSVDNDAVDKFAADAALFEASKP